MYNTPIAGDAAAEYVAIKDLVPWRHNPRKNDPAVASVAASIKEFGFGAPVLARKANKELIAGHTRIKAALSLGMTTVPCRFLDLSEERAHLLAVADNRLNELATWDDAVLGAVLADIKNANPIIDLAITGLTERELHELLSVDGPGDEDDAPALSDVAVTRLGDLVVLGDHRLLCGDSTSPADLARLMAGEIGAICFTDPPYNADYKSRVDSDRSRPWGGIANDHMTDAAFATFLTDAFDAIKMHLADAASVYAWTDWQRYPLFARAFGAAFTHKSTIVWNKAQFGLGRLYRTQYELCLFGCSGERVGTWLGGHDEADVWTVSRDGLKGYQHPTQKPVELARRALVNSSRVGDVVLDAFGGSGSTMMAAQATGRRARLMELDARYCDVIVARWERATGGKAVRK